MDETARAIARLQEQAKPERSSETRRSNVANPKPQAGQVSQSIARRKSEGPPPSISTKRPKTGGA